MISRRRAASMSRQLRLQKVADWTPTLTTDFNGILTGEQLGHIHGENEHYRCHL